MPRSFLENQRIKEMRFEKIVETALFLFSYNGYDNVTIDMITEKAEVSHGLFYHYFSSKIDVLEELNNSKKAIKILRDSLYPIPSELNELDWKSGLSDKSERIAQHISAFANMKGGGILVYGVNNDGTCFSITKDEIDKIVQTLGNIAHNNLVYSIPIEHSILL